MARRRFKHEPGSGPAFTMPGPGEEGYVDPVANAAHNEYLDAQRAAFLDVVEAGATAAEVEAAWAVYQQARGNRPHPVPRHFIYEAEAVLQDRAERADMARDRF